MGLDRYRLEGSVVGFLGLGGQVGSLLSGVASHRCGAAGLGCETRLQVRWLACPHPLRKSDGEQNQGQGTNEIPVRKAMGHGDVSLVDLSPGDGVVSRLRRFPASVSQSRPSGQVPMVMSSVTMPG
jgi:hypothetical protein